MHFTITCFLLSNASIKDGKRNTTKTHKCIPCRWEWVTGKNNSMHMNRREIVIKIKTNPGIMMNKHIKTMLIQTARYGRVQSLWLTPHRRSKRVLRTTPTIQALFCVAPAKQYFDSSIGVAACRYRTRKYYQIGRLFIPLCNRHTKTKTRDDRILFVEISAGVC